MRRLFIVLAKVAGLLQLYWTLASFLNVGSMFFTMLGRSDSDANSIFYIGLFLSLVLLFGTSWLFLFRTEWLADRLKIQGDDEIGNVDMQAVLRAGMRLVGIYVLIYAVPHFVGIMAGSFSLPLAESKLPSHFWAKFIPSVIQITLGIFLVFDTEKVATFISGKKKSPEAKSDSAMS
jgi:hypothetical protein